MWSWIFCIFCTSISRARMRNPTNRKFCLRLCWCTVAIIITHTYLELVFIYYGECVCVCLSLYGVARCLCRERLRHIYNNNTSSSSSSYIQKCSSQTLFFLNIYRSSSRTTRGALDDTLFINLYTYSELYICVWLLIYLFEKPNNDVW